MTPNTVGSKNLQNKVTYTSARFTQGYGTCDETLIRVLVSRSEEDLKKIMEEYRAMYDVSLQDDIMVT